MKRFPLALLAFLGLVSPVLANPLDVLTRTEKGAALSQVDNDSNFSLIETAVHNLQPITLQAAPCTIPMGCTGAASLPTGMLKGAGTSPIIAAVPGTDFQIPIVSTGVLKGTGSAVGSAVAGSDYQAPINVSGVLKGSGGGNVAAAVAGTDYQIPITTTGVLKGSGSAVVQAAAGTDYQAPVNATGLLKSNGTSGNVTAAGAGTDYQAPVSATGLLKSNGTSGNVSAAAVGTDYQAPVSATGLLKSNGTSGNVTAAVANTDYEAADSDTLCLANATTTGFHARTGAGTCAERTITAGTGVAVTGGDGTADPVVSLANKRTVSRGCTLVPTATSAATAGVLPGASSPAESFPIWNFPDAVTSYVDMQCSLDTALPSTSGVAITYCVASTLASGVVGLNGSMRLMSQSIDLDSTAFTYTTSPVTINVTMSATVGRTTCNAVTFTNGTNMNSAGPGDMINLRLWRDGAGDTNNGTAELLQQSVSLREP